MILNHFPKLSFIQRTIAKLTEEIINLLSELEL